MPNKRAKNKTQLKIWMDADTKASVQKMLEKKGLTLTDEILGHLEQLLRKEFKNEKSKKTDKDSK